MRRKLHHAKDLPIDITRYIEEGVNLPSAFIINDKPPSSYAFAVETVGCMTYEDIVTACLSRTVPAEDVLNGIKASLCCPSNEDDDVAIIDSNMSINLLDTFSAAHMFDIP
ncbi:hypothetical protein B0A49_11834 [Cryomyces minteri]|uniref:Uncharacterized protein n=1 Tax=Cryomyces minteri TaxID=331657 RepID=A0A4U0XKG4_9PEZI|nr:hypothetical protein B0A49_11834 [Cryomyces minteri]